MHHRGFLKLYVDGIYLVLIVLYIFVNSVRRLLWPCNCWTTFEMIRMSHVRNHIAPLALTHSHLQRPDGCRQQGPLEYHFGMFLGVDTEFHFEARRMTRSCWVVCIWNIFSKSRYLPGRFVRSFLHTVSITSNSLPLALQWWLLQFASVLGVVLITFFPNTL